jgi:hypothetical protein
MRRQVLAGIVAMGLFTVAPVYATFCDFSADPNLATQWSQFDYYNYYGNPDYSTAAWNSTNQNLDLTTSGFIAPGAYRCLYKTGETRSDTDGVTVTFSNYQDANTAAGWNSGVGLYVSSLEKPYIFADGGYELLFDKDTGAYNFKVFKNGITVPLSTTPVAELPSTIELKVVRDGSDYVFYGNGAELCRDSSVPEALPHYFMEWSAANTLSVSADNFGTIPGVPEPGTLVLLATGLLGLVCYAWRQRK